MGFTNDILLAGSADTQFVGFKASDFAKNEPWPSYTKLDKGSKTQGRVNWIGECQEGFIVCGQRGAVKWVITDNEMILTKSTESGETVSCVGNKLFLKNGSVIEIDF